MQGVPVPAGTKAVPAGTGSPLPLPLRCTVVALVPFKERGAAVRLAGVVLLQFPLVLFPYCPLPPQMVLGEGTAF